MKKNTNNYIVHISIPRDSQLKVLSTILRNLAILLGSRLYSIAINETSGQNLKQKKEERFWHNLPLVTASPWLSAAKRAPLESSSEAGAAGPDGGATTGGGGGGGAPPGGGGGAAPAAGTLASLP